jgi:hypothetical protein
VCERPSLLITHLGSKLAHSEGGSVVRRMRVCELVVAIMAAKLIEPSLAIGEACGAVQVYVFRSRRFDGGRRGHENKIGTLAAPVNMDGRA